MQAEEIKQLLLAELADSDITVSVDGSHVAVTVVSAAFEGLRPVKRQQMVYAALNEQIASGAIHAVNITAQTPAEHSA